MDDLEELIGVIAAKHNVLLGRDDPAAIIPTLVKIGVDRAVKGLTDDQEARKAELRAFAIDLRAEFVKALEGESTAIANKIRSAVQMDLDKAGASAATLVANVNHAHTRPARIYWMAIGLLTAVVLVGIGFAAGQYLR